MRGEVQGADAAAAIAASRRARAWPLPTSASACRGASCPPLGSTVGSKGIRLHKKEVIAVDRMGMVRGMLSRPLCWGGLLSPVDGARCFFRAGACCRDRAARHQRALQLARQQDRGLRRWLRRAARECLQSGASSAAAHAGSAAACGGTAVKQHCSIIDPNSLIPSPLPRLSIGPLTVNAMLPAGSRGLGKEGEKRSTCERE